MELDEQLIAKVKNYQPSTERLGPLKDVPLLFLVGISGAGKNAITTALLKAYANSYHEFVTHTTRAPRENHGVMERDGVEYHFVDFEQASAMLDNHDYIEANVYSANIYGTSVAELEAAQQEHRIAIGDIDVNGVANFMRLGLNAKPVFILPPNYEVWQQRLLSRYKQGIDKNDWILRIQTARREIEYALANDYFYLIVNDDLQATIEQVNAIAHSQFEAHRTEESMAAAKDLLNGINDALEQNSAE